MTNIPEEILFEQTTVFNVTSCLVLGTNDLQLTGLGTGIIYCFVFREGNRLRLELKVWYCIVQCTNRVGGNTSRAA